MGTERNKAGIRFPGKKVKLLKNSAKFEPKMRGLFQANVDVGVTFRDQDNLPTVSLPGGDDDVTSRIFPIQTRRNEISTEEISSCSV